MSEAETELTTANNASLMRAAHLVLDGEPKLLNDWLAGPLSGLKDAAAVMRAVQIHATGLAQRGFSPDQVAAYQRHARATTAGRARITEDRLAAAMDRGIKQYVMLGAGFETYPYRHPELVDTLRIFEVDHPVHQEDKRNHLKGCKIDVPGNVTFVPVNFETDSIMDCLRSNGFRKDEPAFCSWNGVTPFLTDAAIFQTLGELAAMAPGSEIVFDLLKEPGTAEDRDALSVIRTGRGKGEHTVAEVYEFSEVVPRIKALGFKRVESLNAEAQKRYFADRVDGLTLPTTKEFLSARL